MVPRGRADGFNVMPPYFPGGLDDFATGVIPILQKRGLFRTEYKARRCATISACRVRQTSIALLPVSVAAHGNDVIRLRPRPLSPPRRGPRATIEGNVLTWDSAYAGMSGG